MKLSIIPTEFKETCIGKTFAASKVRTEFHLLMNRRSKLRIDVINSRFSRKKTVYMDGELVHKFDKTSLNNLRWNWNYSIDGQQVEFSVEPNSSGSGADLRINGTDFFDYVVGVLDNNAADPGMPRESGLARLNTSIVFVVPPSSGTENESKPATRDEPLPSLVAPRQEKVANMNPSAVRHISVAVPPNNHTTPAAVPAKTVHHDLARPVHPHSGSAAYVPFVDNDEEPLIDM